MDLKLSKKTLQKAIKQFKEAPKTKKFACIIGYKFIANNRVAYELYRRFKRKEMK